MITNTAISFVSKECKDNQHQSCCGHWIGLGLEIICSCICGHNKNSKALEQVGGPFSNATELIISGGDPKRQSMVK